LSHIVTPNVEKLTHREVTGIVPDYVRELRCWFWTM